MTAAACARFLSETHRVTLVESDAIGTIGVGEATIPQIALFNQALGIDEAAFLAATGGTYKLGIAFDGWGAPGERYIHAFGTIGRDAGLIAFHHYWLRGRALGLADDLWSYALNARAAYGGRMRPGVNPAQGNGPALPRAYHFDAGRYAAFLRSYAEARGVTRTEGRIEHVERDGATGDIAALRLEGDRSLTGSLFIDCSGLRGLLIGEAMGSGYHDWSRWLPCNRALAVPCENAGPPIPYTRAIARAAGWQWRIPLQHRIGNGIVYCDAHLADERAADILLAHLDGEAQADPRPIRFTTGRRERFWVGNCVAIGLSGGFLEPLESTSIHLIQSGISRLLKLLPGTGSHPALAAEFDRQTIYEYEAILDFLILHYHANRRPEPFWQEVATMAIPDKLAARVALFRARGEIVREHDELFTEPGWLQLMIGQGIMPEAWHPLADAITPGDLKDFMASLAGIVARDVAAMPAHADLLARLPKAA
jgi:tryptophan halogenase